MSPRLATFLLATLAVGPSGAAEDWPQFRGPRGDGLSTATDLPAEWNETRTVAWKVRTPGRGRSSPVVLGDRVWLTAAEETPASPEQIMLKLADHPDPGQVYVGAAFRCG